MLCYIYDAHMANMACTDQMVVRPASVNLFLFQLFRG